MPSCRFSLNLNPDTLLEYYRGVARNMLVLSDNGQTVSFPVAELRQFVTSEGVRGYFEITFTDDYKLVRLTRLSNRKPAA